MQDIFTECAKQDEKGSLRYFPALFVDILFMYIKKHWSTLLICYLLFTGLKSLVNQGVKNPLVDLLSLEDKTLDEVK